MKKEQAAIDVRELRENLSDDIAAVLRRHYRMCRSDFPPDQIFNTQISVLLRIANAMCANLIPDFKEKEEVRNEQKD